MDWSHLEDSELAQEFELLSAVFGDDIKIVDRKESKGADSSDGRFLLSVVLEQSQTVEPQFHFVKCQMNALVVKSGKNPVVTFPVVRGLTSQQEQELLKEIETLATESIDTPMLFQLFERGKDIVFQLNSDPKGECPICLSDFIPLQDAKGAEEYICLPKCHHRFHTKCFIDFLKNQLKHEQKLLDEPVTLGFERKPPYHNIKPQIKSSDMVEAISHLSNPHCPVCRSHYIWNDISFLTHHIKNYATVFQESPQESSSNPHLEYIKSELYKKQLEDRKALFEKQMRAGGIIVPNSSSTMQSNGFVLPATFQAPAPMTATATTTAPVVVTTRVADSQHLSAPVTQSAVPQKSPRKSPRPGHDTAFPHPLQKHAEQKPGATTQKPPKPKEKQQEKQQQQQKQKQKPKTDQSVSIQITLKARPLMTDESAEHLSNAYNDYDDSEEDKYDDNKYI